MFHESKELKLLHLSVFVFICRSLQLQRHFHYIKMSHRFTYRQYVRCRHSLLRSLYFTPRHGAEAESMYKMTCDSCRLCIIFRSLNRE